MGEFPHFQLFTNHDWGLIIYDEVHLLPAPVFRVTAEIQARRRLGLTATLVREDGREEDVFSLIGPKKYDVPWKDLEQQGWIATADCTEVRVEAAARASAWNTCWPRTAAIKYRIAAENPLKMRRSSTTLLERHADDNVLVIGQYIEQLEEIAGLSGRAADHRQDAQPGARRAVRRLPRRARSSCWWSRRSRTSRLTCPTPTSPSRCRARSARGRKRRSAWAASCAPRATARPAHFYTLVTRDTKDQDFSANRQLFLTEQGYRYDIMDAEELVPGLSAILAEEQAILDREGADALADWVAARRGRRSLAAPLLGDGAASAPAEPPKKRRGRPPKARPAATEATAPLVPDEPQAANGNGHHAASNGSPSRDRSHLRLIK